MGHVLAVSSAVCWRACSCGLAWQARRRSSLTLGISIGMPCSCPPCAWCAHSSATLSYFGWRLTCRPRHCLAPLKHAIVNCLPICAAGVPVHHYHLFRPRCAPQATQTLLFLAAMQVDWILLTPSPTLPRARRCVLCALNHMNPTLPMARRCVLCTLNHMQK